MGITTLYLVHVVSIVIAIRHSEAIEGFSAWGGSLPLVYFAKVMKQFRVCYLLAVFVVGTALYMCPSVLNYQMLARQHIDNQTGNHGDSKCT